MQRGRSAGVLHYQHTLTAIVVGHDATNDPERRRTHTRQLFLHQPHNWLCVLAGLGIILQYLLQRVQARSEGYEDFFRVCASLVGVG